MKHKTSKAIMNAARGEACTLNIAGVCSYNKESTVFAEHPDGTGGSNRLSGPLAGGNACHACHDCIDGRTPPALSQEDREYYMRRSMIRTTNRLIELGLVSVKGLGR